MAGLPPFATGTPELIVEKVLMTSYDVVKYVAQNMSFIVSVQGGIEAVQAVGDNIAAIIAIAPKLDSIEQLAENLEAVAAVADNVEQILNIYDDLQIIVNAATQTAADSAAAVAAKNESITIRDNLLTSINVLGNILNAGEDPTVSYDPNLKRLTFGMPRAPSNTLTIGTVSSGLTAAANISGATPDQVLDLTLPTGNNAWTPVFALVANGSALVQKIVDWTGGSGAKPAINVYVTSTGFSSNIADGVNVRGAAGAGTGDMLVGTYDPTGKNGDAFSMGNMVETSVAKILTDVERTKLAGIATGATANSSNATLLARANHTGTQAISTVAGLQAAIDAKISVSQKNVANGVAPLDASILVPLVNLPASVKGTLQYQGDWDATANTPAIPSASASNKGWYYKVGTAGTTNISGINEWAVSDWIVSNGTGWDKVKNTESVFSVAGKVGAVTLDKTDVGLNNVANKSEADMVAAGAIADALGAKASSAQGSLADTAVQPADIGTIATADIYSGTAAPDNGTGVNGDIYFQYDS
jgi:hypothetical protein